MIDAQKLDTFVRSHAANPELLRADAFEPFMADRQKRLLALIAAATGKSVSDGSDTEEGVDVEFEGDAAEVEATLS